MFPDVDLVRSVQQELDIVIQDGVANIVQLLRNSESGTSSGAARVEEDTFEARNRLKNFSKMWDHQKDVKAKHKGQVADGAEGQKVGLTDELVRQGLLTQKMVKELQREWSEANNKDSTKDS